MHKRKMSNHLTFKKEIFYRALALKLVLLIKVVEPNMGDSDGYMR